MGGRGGVTFTAILTPWTLRPAAGVDHRGSEGLDPAGQLGLTGLQTLAALPGKASAREPRTHGCPSARDVFLLRWSPLLLPPPEPPASLARLMLRGPRCSSGVTGRKDGAGGRTGAAGSAFLGTLHQNSPFCPHSGSQCPRGEISVTKETLTREGPELTLIGLLLTTPLPSPTPTGSHQACLRLCATLKS